MSVITFAAFEASGIFISDPVQAVVPRGEQPTIPTDREEFVCC